MKKAFEVAKFSGKIIVDWEAWSTKQLQMAKRKFYHNLLMGRKPVPTVSDVAVAKPDDKNTKLSELNKQAFEDIILSINHIMKQGKIMFYLVKNCTNSTYRDGNCKVAWDCMVAKCAPKTAHLLLKLKKRFNNCVLDDMDRHPDEGITELDSM